MSVLMKVRWQRLILLVLGFWLVVAIHWLPDDAPESFLSDQVIVESFSAGDRLPWHLQHDPQTQGIRWPFQHRLGVLKNIGLDQPGLHFEARTTTSYKSHLLDAATVAWPIGTRPFHFSMTVVIDRGNQQNWFEPGLGIALATAPPEQMQAHDFAITFALQQAGVTPAVRQGKVFQLDPDNEHQLADTVISPFIPPIQHRIHALDWPQHWLDGTKLRLEVTRTPNSVLKFIIYDLNRPKDDLVWWSGEYQLPANFASQPLQYVTLQRIPVTAGHIGYPDFQLTGRVIALQGIEYSLMPDGGP
jgi:hypothetical protein